MASRTGRARVALLFVGCALVGLGVWRGEAVWWWVMTERVYAEGSEDNHEVRGWFSRCRWGEQSPHGPAEHWFLETGYRAMNAERRRRASDFVVCGR